MRPTDPFALALALVLTAACGGGGDSSNGGGGGDAGTASGPRSGTPCEQLAQAICPQLQACPKTAGDSECQYVNQNGSLGISCTMCTSHFERNMCGDTTKTDAFFQACLAAIDAKKATCGPHPFNSDEQGLVLPSECSALMECGAGPCKD